MKTALVLRTLARILVLGAALALPVFPASAQAHTENSVWKKTGDGYAIRFASLDLSRPDDRQTVLQTITRASSKICVSRRTPLILLRSCQRQVVAETLANASPAVREAVQLALSESNGAQLAMR